MISYCKYLIVLLLIVVSCNTNNKDREGVLTINVGTEPKTLDPTLNAALDGGIYIGHIFEGLLNKKQDGSLVPGVAERWDISDDRTVYTFHLRTNAMWSDGKVVTANDFVYAWRRVVDPKVASEYNYQMEILKNAKEITEGKLPLDALGVKAIDDFTLEVTLVSPTPYFEQLAAFQTYFPVREDIVEANPDGWSLDPKTYIGNGAFKVTERKIDSRIVLERNEYYWNSSDIKPNKLIFILTDSYSTILAGIKDGSIHYSSLVPVKEFNSLKEEGYIVVKPYLGLYYYNLNLEKTDVLKDVRIRKALSLAIDRNYIVETVTKAGEVPAAAVVPNGVLESSGKDFREYRKNYFSVEKEDYEKNVEEAKKLLAEAGYPNGEGFPILNFRTDPGEHIDIFEAIQYMWNNQLGINTTIMTEEWAVFQTSRNNGEFDIARNRWIADYDDPVTFLGVFLSRSAFNNSRYKSSTYDNLLDQASKTDNQQQRMQILHKAEDTLMEDLPIIPIYYYTSVQLQNPKLKGIEYSTLGTLNFSKAYLEE